MIGVGKEGRKRGWRGKEELRKEIKSGGKGSWKGATNVGWGQKVRKEPRREPRENEAGVKKVRKK